MAGKFTPGAWILGDENNQHAQVCLGESGCSVDLKRFADYPTMEGMSRDEMRANAHLIMASPDLYSVVSNLVHCMDAEPDGFHPGFIKSAKAALAKANGWQG